MRFELQYSGYHEIVGSVVAAMARANALRSRGYSVRIVNPDTGFVVSDWS